MNIPLRSTTLIALAAGAFAADTVAPPAAPVQVPVVPMVKDSSLKLTVGGQVQFRADYSDARNSGGTDYNTTNGADGKADDVDFYLSRCRLFVNGTYGDYTIRLGLRADNADKTVNTAGANARTFEIHYASITRKFGDAELNQSIQLGLDYAFFNSASYGGSSAHLFPANRATIALMAPRGAGIGYRLDTSWIYFGADVQNNMADDNQAPLAGQPETNTGYQSEGLCYTARLEVTPTGAWAIKPKDFKETFAGKAGNGWMAALETGYNAHDVVAITGAEDARWRDTLVVGAESLLHLDSLSALIGYRWQRQTTNTDIGAPTGVSGADNPVYSNIFTIQAGYALPCMLVSGAVLEPLIRYSNIDMNAAASEATSYGSGEYGTSGNMYDLGVNWYPSVGVYNNKVSLLWTHWLGEATDSGAAPTDNYKAKADIVRVQYQWIF